MDLCRDLCYLVLVKSSKNQKKDVKETSIVYILHLSMIPVNA